MHFDHRDHMHHGYLPIVTCHRETMRWLLHVLIWCAMIGSARSINLKVSPLMGDIVDVRWVNDWSVHVRTDKGFAYTSSNQGGSFEIFQPCQKEDCIQVMKPLPGKNKHLMLLQGPEESWVVDANATVVQHIPHALEQVVHHPIHVDWMLAVACTTFFFDMQQSCNLFVSKDGGRSLDQVDEGVCFRGPEPLGMAMASSRFRSKAN